MGERGPLPRGEKGLRRTAVRVLRALHALGTASLPEIARRAGMSPQLVRYHILKRDGLLARRHVRIKAEATSRSRRGTRAFRRFALTMKGRATASKDSSSH